MGRDLQKRKNRSSRPAVRQPSSRGVAKRNPRGSDIIARNWDKTLTTSQNYKRLGLVGRLNAPTGGVEKDLAALRAGNKHAAGPSSAKDPFAIAATGPEGVVGEVRVERDENGRIVRILGRGDGRSNPLNDPLNHLDTDSEAEEDEFADDGETWGGIEEGGKKKKKSDKKGKKEDGPDTRTEVVRLLEEEANRPREKRVRNQSDREREWLASLVERHGDDVRAMARDRKLNPMQQTEADIAKRLRKFNGEQ